MNNEFKFGRNVLFFITIIFGLWYSTIFADTTSSSYAIPTMAPCFIEVPPIDPSLVKQISRFRSTVGHPYYEGDQLKCESDKHYLQFCPGIDADQIVVKAPFYGTITTIRDESPLGFQIEIQVDSKHYLYYTNRTIVLVLFHINPDPNNPFKIGENVYPGMLLGTHATLNTFSDMAVREYTVNPPLLSSAFLYMTPMVLKQYGVFPNDMIISQQDRDAYPSNCQNRTDPMPPPPPGGPEDWVVLKSCPDQIK